MPVGPAMIPLAQRFDDAGYDDDFPAVAGEEKFRGLESGRGEQDVAPEPLHQPAPTDMPDGDADVVARAGGQHPDPDYEGDVQGAGAGVDGGGDQDGLPGHRDPEVLEEQQPAHRDVAGGVQHRRQRGSTPGSGGALTVESQVGSSSGGVAGRANSRRRCGRAENSGATDAGCDLWHCYSVSSP